MSMRFAYADPPYLGCAERLYGHLHADAADYDDPAAHKALIERLVSEFSGAGRGWALSCQTKDLRIFLPWCPEGTRVAAWCKPFSFFNSTTCDIQYSWEPVLVSGGRRSRHPADKPRDFHICNPFGVSASERAVGTVLGSKPEAFAHWVFGMLGAEPGDEFVDLFPGSGAVTKAWESWCRLTRIFAAKKEAAEERTAAPGLPFSSQDSTL